MKCPQPLDPNSVCHCTKHMAAERARKGPNGEPGSANFLYGDGYEDRRGRHPNNLAALAASREQRTRAFLAEQGISPDSAAVSLKAAIEVLLKIMPATEADAMTQTELFEKAIIPTRNTGQQALWHLLETGRIQRIGKGLAPDRVGVKGNRYRYFATSDDLQDSKRKLAEGHAFENAGRHLRGR